jgi:nicotinamidase-related amidase
MEAGMALDMAGPDLQRSALIVVDMQNDFLHADGAFGRLAVDAPERAIDMAFLASTIAPVKRLADAFRQAGRPVLYVAHVLKADYSDAAFPYWRGHRMRKAEFLFEGTWGARIVDELTPRAGEHLVVKKGFGGFSNTPLDTILRNYGVTTCVVCGVTTCVCVSTTIRGGVEHNYRIIAVRDGMAEVHRDAHEAELKTIRRVFGDVLTSDQVIEALKGVKAGTLRSDEGAPVLG